MAEAKTEKPAKGSGKADKGGKPADKMGAEKGGKAAKGKGKPAAPEAKLASAEELAMPKDYVPRLKKIYAETIRPKLVQEFGYKNALEVPQIDKVVINMGVG